MGFLFYFICVILALLFFGLAFRHWCSRNKDKIFEYFCYIAACNRGWINPAKDEYDKIALDYAIKYNKKVTWTVYN